MPITQERLQMLNPKNYKKEIPLLIQEIYKSTPEEIRRIQTLLIVYVDNSLYYQQLTLAVNKYKNNLYMSLSLPQPQVHSQIQAAYVKMQRNFLNGSREVPQTSPLQFLQSNFLMKIQDYIKTQIRNAKNFSAFRGHNYQNTSDLAQYLIIHAYLI